MLRSSPPRQRGASGRFGGPASLWQRLTHRSEVAQQHGLAVRCAVHRVRVFCCVGRA